MILSEEVKKPQRCLLGSIQRPAALKKASMGFSAAPPPLSSSMFAQQQQKPLPPPPPQQQRQQPQEKKGTVLLTWADVVFEMLDTI